MTNQELAHIQLWFNVNKLSLNITKTKYSLFYSSAYNDCIPLLLPKLKICNLNIKRETTMKFLGVLLDENLTWKVHIRCIESKVSKNLGILYKTRYILNEQCTKQLYFSFIHSYLNYGNIASGANKSKLNILLKRQKHDARIIYFEDKFTHAKPLMQKVKALNIYQLNIYQILLFMHKVKNKNIHNVFKKSFNLTNNKYETKSSNLLFYKPFCRTKYTQFSISYRGPHIWNSLVPNKLQEVSYENYKQKTKQMCLTLENETQYF